MNSIMRPVRRSGVPLLFLLVVLAIMAGACGAKSQAAPVSPDDLAVVWEAWDRVSQVDPIIRTAVRLK